MSSEINEVQISIIILIIILLIKYYNELEETLNISYQTEQEEEESNTLPLILLCLQHNRMEIDESIDLRILNRSISKYWFDQICLNMPDFEFKRHFRLTRSTFE